MANQTSPIFKPVDPADLQGPFSAQLQPPPPQQQQPGPPVLAGKATSLGYIAQQFLQGATEGRVQSFARKEQEKFQNLKILESYVQNVVNDPNVTAEGKKYAMDQYSRALGGELFQATGGGKKSKKADTSPGPPTSPGGDQQQGGGITGHLTNILRDVATGMTGGKMPKGGPSVDPKAAIGSIYGEISKPQYSVNGIVKENEGMLQTIADSMHPDASTEAFAAKAIPHIRAIAAAAGEDRAQTIYGNYASRFQPAPKVGSEEYQREQANRGVFGPPQSPSQPQAGPPDLMHGVPVPPQSNIGPPSDPSGMPSVLPGDKIAAFPDKDRHEEEVSFIGPDGKQQRGYGTRLRTARGTAWYVEDPSNPNQSVRVTGVQRAPLAEPKPIATYDKIATLPDGSQVQLIEDRTKPPAERFTDYLTGKPVDPSKLAGASIRSADTPADKDTGKLKQYTDAYKALGKSEAEAKSLGAKQVIDEAKQASEARGVNIQIKREDLIPPMPVSGQTVTQFTPAQQQAVSLAEQSLRGLLTGSRGAKMAKEVSAGMDLISAKTGIPQEELQSRKMAREAAQKDYASLRRVNDSVQAFDNALQRHGKILVEKRATLPSTDVVKLNSMLQSGAEQFNLGGLSSQSVDYAIALQAVRNEYARIISGGTMSTGQTRVDALKSAGEIIAPGFSKGQVGSAIQQMKTEVAQRTAGYQDKINDLQRQFASPIVPELTGGTYNLNPGQSNGPSIKITTPDGKTLDIFDPKYRK